MISVIHGRAESDEAIRIHAGGRRMEMDWDAVACSFQSALDQLEWDADLEIRPEKQCVMIRYAREDVALTAESMEALYRLIEEQLGVERFMSIWIDFLPKHGSSPEGPQDTEEGAADPGWAADVAGRGIDCVIPAGGRWMPMDWARIGSAFEHASTKLGWDAEFELFPGEQRVLVRFPGDRAELVGTTMTEFYRTLEAAIGMEQFMSIWIEYLSRP
jgi:hypothetical protein